MLVKRFPSLSTVYKPMTMAWSKAVNSSTTSYSLYVQHASSTSRPHTRIIPFRQVLELDLTFKPWPTNKPQLPGQPSRHAYLYIHIHMYMPSPDHFLWMFDKFCVHGRFKMSHNRYPARTPGLNCRFLVIHVGVVY